MPKSYDGGKSEGLKGASRNVRSMKTNNRNDVMIRRNVETRQFQYSNIHPITTCAMNSVNSYPIDNTQNAVPHLLSSNHDSIIFFHFSHLIFTPLSSSSLSILW